MMNSVADAMVRHQQTDLAASLDQAKGLFNDLSFAYVRDWKGQNPSRRVIGFLPIYIPREIIHAHGMLPVGLFGAGDRIPVVKGDAYFQSYICHLPRTVIEMALNGNLDAFDGFIFPAICDVIRNLSGIFQLKFNAKLIRYLDFPQNFDPEVGGVFYRTALRQLSEDLARLNGVAGDVAALNHSISLYNENRRLVKDLSDFRAASPHKVSAVEYYLILRAGQTLTIEDHNAFVRRVMPQLAERDALPEDKIRVVVSGSFCEQPPLGLIRTIENAGCYIVEDDFQLGLQWMGDPIPDDTADPLAALVDAYLTKSTYSSAVYDGDHPKEEQLVAQVRERRADGVIFCAPSFCDPALLDRPLLEKAMDRSHIRHISFQYHENLGQFHVVKEQAGTFADMIKLWD
ncbi:benzoyl-CoA reductase subunit C [candidate division KSB1 bacterium]|nr:benzoyl-CoA reductase subunit C [candidate division KSB1 bacterium]